MADSCVVAGTDVSAKRVLAATDKFKGTATSAEVGGAVVVAAGRLGWAASFIALSDGGDGLLEVFGGPNRHTQVTGPLADSVRAGWRLDGEHAVLESALASGLVLAGGAQRNNPLTATSRGTGELIDAAATAGAAHILVGLGGVACTDGGAGAVDAIAPSTLAALEDGSLELTVCCDVLTRYADAAIVFGPQKGATPTQVRELTERLRRERERLEQRFGVDVGAIPGGGAAGGLAGGLAAIGGRLRPGFDVVAERVGLAALIRSADLVITGEGRLDASSFDGKVVGGVAALARSAGVPVTAIVGDVEDGTEPPFPVVSLVERYGRTPALDDPLGSVQRATVELLAAAASTD
ncbi:MAG: glycerate 2-kinase [Pseudonocardiales bacterium]|nr:glycerate 2-kinase [Pseudonocardiales bacterium]